MWVGGQPDVFSEKRFRDRVRFISVVFAVAYSLIGVRLFYLQVIKGDALSQLSESNRTQLIFFRAPRGDIYDRKGRLLVTNRPSWSLMYSVPQKSVADRERVTALLEPFMKKFPQKQWNARLQRAFKSKQMVRLAEDVPDDISFGLQELGELVPGLQVVMEFRRGYLSESSAGHVLGYLGEINDRELRDDQWADRKLGDLIGKMGVEKVLDRDLRGTDGGMLIEVDSIGRLKRVIRELPSEKGKSVQLTIDLDIQRAAREALEATPTKRGAAVAFDVNTGAILGWVSAPSFDPSGSLAEDVTDPNLPFFDRVYKGAYPPGSVYKLMTAVAALENRNVNFSERVTCIGYMSLFDKKNVEKRYGCWKVHGSVDFWEAVAHSCNCYFYTIGPRVGPEIIQKISQSFGLGESAQKIFPGENIGTIPSPAWKKRKGLGGWSTGDTFNMSIGQGFVTSTPIQIAIMTMGMANHGTIWSPYLVDKMVDSSGKVVYQSAKTVRREISLKESTWDVMDRAMRGVVVGGTGGATNIPYLDVRGKSGTAQNPHGETHAWFVAFAGYPGEKPSVAVCVFVENGGGGGGVAAPGGSENLGSRASSKTSGEHMSSRATVHETHTITEGFFSRTFLLDGILLLATLLTVGIGIMMVHSTEVGGTWGYFSRQLVASVVGLFGMVLLAVLPYQVFRTYIRAIYAFMILLLLSVLVLGVNLRGTRGWFHLGPIYFQAVELAKITYVLSLAGYLDQRIQWSYPRSLMTPFLLAGFPILLILAQPDFSSSLVFFPAALVMFYFAGARTLHLLGVCLVGALATGIPLASTYFRLLGPALRERPIMFFLANAFDGGWPALWLFLGVCAVLVGVWWFFKQMRVYIPSVYLWTVMILLLLGTLGAVAGDRALKDYQRKRLVAFVNPELDPLGGGYNVRQSQIAIGSGQVLGKGYGNGTQSRLGFLPSRHTDFIFSVIGEELGFIRSLGVLILYFLIVWRGYDIAVASRDRYGSLVAAGFATMFAFYALLNLGMTMGMAPVAGVPLPMVSYGGSSVVSSMWIVGIMLSIHLRRYLL